MLYESMCTVAKAYMYISAVSSEFAQGVVGRCVIHLLVFQAFLLHLPKDQRGCSLEALNYNVRLRGRITCSWNKVQRGIVSCMWQWSCKIKRSKYSGENSTVQCMFLTPFSVHLTWSDWCAVYHFFVQYESRTLQCMHCNMTLVEVRVPPVLLQ